MKKVKKSEKVNRRGGELASSAGCEGVRRVPLRPPSAAADSGTQAISDYTRVLPRQEVSGSAMSEAAAAVVVVLVVGIEQ